MPNNAYLRSVKRERELVNEFRAKGWMACRSAGSKSPYDVWAVNPKTGDVVLIQVKTEKGGRTRKDTLILKIERLECWLYRYC